MGGIPRFDRPIIRYPSPPGQLRGPSAGEDDYLDKLAKYVPAPSVAFVAVASGFVDSDAFGWILIAVALLGTWLYVYIRGEVPVWTYGLVLVAALVWSFCATDLGGRLLSLDAGARGFVLACGTFLIPAADTALTTKRTRATRDDE